MRKQCPGLMAACLMLALLGTGIAYGAGQSGTNYTMKVDVFAAGGGWSNSANYTLSHATGQSTPIGYAEGSAYRMYAG